MTPLLGPADADHYRIKGDSRYPETRRYIDPLPTDDIAEATPDSWPSVSTVKNADGKNWDFVTRARIAEHLAAHPHELDGLDLFRVKKRLYEIDAAAKNRAFTRGHDVHAMFENKLLGRTGRPLPGAEAQLYEPAVDAFLDDWQPELIAAEVVCINRGLNGHGHGGTCDAMIRINGENVLPDWKSRGDESPHNAYPEERNQLGGYCGSNYMIAQGPDGPTRMRLPQFAYGLIVSIKPDGYRAYPIDLGEAWLQWQSLHTRYVDKLDERIGIGNPWPPKGAVTDLFTLIANSEADPDTFNALWAAHKAGWTPEHTAAAQARLTGTQTPSLAIVK